MTPGATTTSNRERSCVDSPFMKFRVLIEQDEDGVFVAEVPALPGCVSQGAARQEAIRNVEEAISAYVESLNERGEPVPPAIDEELVDVAV